MSFVIWLFDLLAEAYIDWLSMEGFLQIIKEALGMIPYMIYNAFCDPRVKAQFFWTSLKARVGCSNVQEYSNVCTVTPKYCLPVNFADGKPIGLIFDRDQYVQAYNNLDDRYQALISLIQERKVILLPYDCSTIREAMYKKMYECCKKLGNDDQTCRTIAEIVVDTFAPRFDGCKILQDGVVWTPKGTAVIDVLYKWSGLTYEFVTSVMKKLNIKTPIFAIILPDRKMYFIQPDPLNPSNLASGEAILLEKEIEGGFSDFILYNTALLMAKKCLES